MEKKLQQFLLDAFAPYGDFPSKSDVIKELLANLLEKYRDLKKQGKGDDEAYQSIINSFGDVSEIMEQLPHRSRKLKERMNLGKVLKETFKAKGDSSKFSQTALKGSDLADVDLHESCFDGSDMREISFDRSDLTNSVFRGSDLRHTSFVKANLTNVIFIGSDLTNACFDDANLSNATLKVVDLHGATFAGSTLLGTDFSQSDLSNTKFDNLNIESVVFDSSSLNNASFKAAILRNINFHHAAVKHAIFDGAKMDKVTYALLRGAGASLDKAIVTK